MKAMARTLGWVGFSSLLVFVACASTKQNGAGDVGTDPQAGSSGSAGTAPSSATAGQAEAGDGGASGPVTDAPDAGAGGNAGEPDPPIEPLCVRCLTVAESQGDIRDLKATAFGPYWIDHGTYDDNHVYQGNGRLVTRSASNGAVREIARNLPGPIALAVTRNYSYLIVDEAGLSQQAVIRVQDVGGPPEVVKIFGPDDVPSAVGASDGDGYFLEKLEDGRTTLSVSHDSGSGVPTILAENVGSGGVLADSGNVFTFVDNKQDPLVLRVSPSGGAPMPFFSPSGVMRPIGGDDQNIYGIEQTVDAKQRFVRMSRSGTDHSRSAPVDPGVSYAVYESGFFVSQPITRDSAESPIAAEIIQGRFSDSAQIRPLYVGPPDSAQYIAGAIDGLYFAGNGSVHLVPYLK